MKKIPYIIGIIATINLIFAVSCSKKEEARKVEVLPEVPSEVQIEVVKDSAPAPVPAPAAAGGVLGAALLPERPAPVPAPAAAVGAKIIIEYISGPKQAAAGEELTLTCGISGEVSTATAYVWRFKNGGDIFEKKTSEPQVKVVLDKAGEYAITCDVVEAGKTLASQRFNISIGERGDSNAANNPE